VTIRKARRARNRALVVPGIMSLLMWMVLGELLLRRPGPVVMPALALLLAVAAITPVGERAVARLLLLARRPRLHQRHTLAPVAEALHRHGVPSGRYVLFVARHQPRPVTGLGRHTLVVSAGFVEDLRAGFISPQGGAAIVAHEIGVMRAGLTRRDPGLLVFLLPWNVWLTFVMALWNIGATLVTHRVMVLCVAVQFVAGIWTGLTEDPVGFVASTVLAVSVLVWLGLRSWLRLRTEVGDLYLHQTGLATQYARMLAGNTDHYTRDRAVRLSYPPAGLAPVDARGADGVAVTAGGR